MTCFVRTSVQLSFGAKEALQADDRLGFERPGNTQQATFEEGGSAAMIRRDCCEEYTRENLFRDRSLPLQGREVESLLN